MENLFYLVFVGAAVQAAGTFHYLRDTLRGTTQPNRITFLLWAVSPLIAFAAALSDGVGWAILPVFMAGFGPLLIFLASFVNKKAYWQLRKFDYGCGFFAVLALLLWAITREPLVAIFFAILSDGLATLPTLIKSWRFPKSETGIAYLASLFCALTGFAALETYALSEYIFVSYLVIANVLLVIAVYRVRLKWWWRGRTRAYRS